MRHATALIASVLLAACATGKSEGQKQIEDLTGEISSLQKELDKGREELKATLAEHDAIVNNTDGDLIGHYKRYVKGIERIESQRDDIRARVEKMKIVADAYFGRWREDNGKIEDAGLRDRDAKNLEATHARYGEIQKRGEEAKATYEPILKTLKGHQQFWANNLNQASAAELRKDGAALGADAGKLYAAIDATSAAARQYNESVAMRYTPPPPEKPPAKG